MDVTKIEEMIEISEENLKQYVRDFKSKNTNSESLYEIHFAGVRLREEKIKILESMLEVRKFILQELTFDITKMYSDDEIDWSLVDTHSFDFKTIKRIEDDKERFMTICVVKSGFDVKYITRWNSYHSTNSREIKPMYYETALRQFNDLENIFE